MTNHVSSNKEYCYINHYVAMMDTIIARLEEIDIVLDSHATERVTHIKIEYVALQFRMIFEEIILASFVANSAKFERVRKKLRSRAKIAIILRETEKINPAFYPKPIKVRDDDDARKILDFDEPYLEKSTILKAHGLCSELLHARNPIEVDINGPEFIENVKDWRIKTIHLLKIHQVKLADDGGMFIVFLRGKGAKTASWVRLNPLDNLT